MYPYRTLLFKFLLKVFAVIVLLFILLIGGLAFISETRILEWTVYETIEPGQEITLEVKPKVEQADYDSTLYITNKDGIKLKFSTKYNRTYWHELTTDIYYDIDTEQKSEFVRVDGETVEEVSPIGETDGVSFEDGHFVMEFTGEKSFDVTNNKSHYVTIENVSDYSGRIYSVVADK